MNSQTINFRFQRFAWPLLVITTLAATARGDGSILFNGSTSKLEHTTANVFGGSSDDVTICVWVYSAATTGSVVQFDETPNALILGHHASANTLSWTSATTGVTGVWSFPAMDGQWNAVAITHDRNPANNTPVARVNFADVAETLTSGAPGTTPRAPNDGYSIGAG
jgi:hypothetical protein